jgi:hypothetical protein
MAFEVPLLMASGVKKRKVSKLLPIEQALVPKRRASCPCASGDGCGQILGIHIFKADDQVAAWLEPAVAIFALRDRLNVLPVPTVGYGDRNRVANCLAQTSKASPYPAHHARDQQHSDTDHDEKPNDN